MIESKLIPLLYVLALMAFLAGSEKDFLQEIPEQIRMLIATVQQNSLELTDEIGEAERINPIPEFSFGGIELEEDLFY